MIHSISSGEIGKWFPVYDAKELNKFNTEQNFSGTAKKLRRSLPRNGHSFTNLNETETGAIFGRTGFFFHFKITLFVKKS